MNHSPTHTIEGNCNMHGGQLQPPLSGFLDSAHLSAMNDKNIIIFIAVMAASQK